MSTSRVSARPSWGEIGSFSVLAGIPGMVVTAICMTGLRERPDPAIVGIKVDSLAVAARYLGGMALLFTLR